MKPIKIQVADLQEVKERRKGYHRILNAWNYWQDNVRPDHMSVNDAYFGAWLRETYGIVMEGEGYWSDAQFTDPDKKLLFLLRFS